MPLTRVEVALIAQLVTLAMQFYAEQGRIPTKDELLSMNDELQAKIDAEK